MSGGSDTPRDQKMTPRPLQLGHGGISCAGIWYGPRAVILTTLPKPEHRWHVAHTCAGAW